MRSSMLLLGVLLAGVGVVDGANQCFDNNCNSDKAYVNIYNCGLTDDDIPELAKCFDGAGRDNIVSVYLDGNNMTTLPADLFQGLSALVQLSFANNKLDALAPGLLGGLGKLSALSLGGNKLTTLPEGLFNDLGNLAYTSLSDNQLTGPPPGLFDGTGKLATVFLSDNDLTTLPAELFNGLGNLYTLHLQGNPYLQCIPENGATVVKVDDISFDQCECYPEEAVLCGKGLDCMSGIHGYYCGDQ